MINILIEFVIKKYILFSSKNELEKLQRQCLKNSQAEILDHSFSFLPHNVSKKLYYQEIADISQFQIFLENVIFLFYFLYVS